MGPAAEFSGPHEQDPGQFMNRVIDALVRDEASTLDEPHIVLVRCVSSGDVTFAGPYGSGLEALLAAEQEMAELSREPGEMHVSIAPLTPPL